MMPRLDPQALADWTGGRWSVWPEAPIRGATHTTRELAPGALFVALAGARADGHDFVEEAFARGAAAALVRRGWTPPPGRPCLVVADPLAALQAAGRGQRDSGDWRIVGVTGSAGKSTVKEMAACLLERLGPTARTRGNFNNAIGLPLSLLGLEPGRHRFGVFELGSNHPGEIAALAAALRPDWGIVTNVGPVHVEAFGDVAGVVREKRALLEALPRDGLAVLNRDTAGYAELAAAAPARRRTASVGAGPADLVLEAAAAEGNGQRLRLREGRTIHVVRLSQPGRHHAMNAMLAALAAREGGLGWAAIDEALAGFEPMAMRWQRREVGGVLVINDAYNANPLSMEAALRTFSELSTNGAKWLVLGEMRELGEAGPALHADLGRRVAEGRWAGLVAVGALAAAMADAAGAAGFPADRMARVPDAAAAASVLRRWVRRGDAVLIKASRGLALEQVAEALAASGPFPEARS